MRICVISFYDESWHRLTDLTIPHLQAYCSKWGYTLYCGQPFASPDTREPYSRFLCTHQLLRDNFDAVMWLNPDAIITNHLIRIEDRLGDEQFVVGGDRQGISANVFIARNTLAVLELTSAIYEGGELLTGPHPFPETASLNRYLRFARYQHCPTILPVRMMNASMPDPTDPKDSPGW